MPADAATPGASPTARAYTRNPPAPAIDAKPSGCYVNASAKIGRGKLITADVERTTFEDMAKMIVADYAANGRKSAERLDASLKHLRETFGASRALAITTDKINAYIAERLQAKAAAATVQCELGALKRMFTLAMQAGKVIARPHIPSLRIRNAREGLFEEPEFRAVLEQLPDYLRPPMTFAYLTGWRKSEILGFTWRNVDFRAQEVRLEPGTTKNDEGRTFPFSVLPPLADLIYRQRERTAKDIEWVFPWAPLRISWRLISMEPSLPSWTRASGIAMRGDCCARGDWVILSKWQARRAPPSARPVANFSI